MVELEAEAEAAEVEPVNAEVEPPDCVFPRALRTGAGRLLCGIDPLGASQAEQRKVVGRIGRQLELQYEQLHGSRSTVFKQCLDPTVEALHRACRRQRREDARPPPRAASRANGARRRPENQWSFARAARSSSLALIPRGPSSFLVPK